MGYDIELPVLPSPRLGAPGRNRTTIVVAIANTNRMRDIEPTHSGFGVDGRIAAPNDPDER